MISLELATPKTPRFSVGDKVKAWHPDYGWEFYRAKVLAVKGGKYVLSWDDGGDNSEIQFDWVRPRIAVTDEDKRQSAFDSALALPKSGQLIYLERMWEGFNRTKFGGQLKPCKIELMRDASGRRLKNLGGWQPATRTILISPRVFVAGLAEMEDTMLHEQCHQAVHEIDKLGYREINNGHGPVWEKWMRHVGLEPKAVYDDDMGVFVKHSEKVAADDEQKWLERNALTRLPAGPGQPIMWRQGGKWKVGVFVTELGSILPDPAHKDTFGYITFPAIRGYSVNGRWVYALRKIEDMSIAGSGQGFYHASEEMKKQLSNLDEMIKSAESLAENFLHNGKFNVR